MLVRPNVITKRKREGKGFSLGELKAAGISIQEAKKFGIAIDKRRKTSHEENIKVLKYIKKEAGG